MSFYDLPEIMRTLTYILMVCGVMYFVFFIYGISQSNNRFVIAALLGTIGGITGVFATPSSDNRRGNGNFAIITIFLVLVATIIIANEFIILAKKKKKENEDFKRNQLVAFFNECVENGINECNTEKEIQKAILIAKKHCLQYKDIKTLFLESRMACEETGIIKEENELKSIKREEIKNFNELKKYSDVSGREKRISIIKDEISYYREKVKTIDAVNKGIISASQQKETDWAIRGGIAEAIGGPVAGIATAIDAQVQNAKIRAQNEANLKSFSSVISTNLSTSGGYLSIIEDLRKEISQVNTLLVGNDDTEKCFSSLNFYDTDVQVSKTGSCTVTTKVKLDHSYFIYDDVPAIIDGTVEADIFDDEKKIGTALMVLPKYGIESMSSLMGMCLFCGKENKKYSVKIRPKELWAMEKGER